ncbi:PBP1A family penicillin-binding protein [Limosilactobacillus ingluviei]|uniref:PBP1A family penicillin-binding protein n=1 Tax=Limosilactobacillus ingluviei TaxID=148604 RepID=UPI0023F2EE54|nr:PBP1A family penicillin-binding protein [Limosilactobacillus ingluviei]
MNNLMKLKDWQSRVGNWARAAWQTGRANFRAFWHRFQLTRWLIVIGLTLFLAVSIYLTVVAKTANVKSLQARLEHPTMVYDRHGDSAGSLYSQKGTYVKLKQVSPHVVDAVLSTEDRNFYREHGFSVKGLGRAAFLLVKNKVMGRNYISGGGSTLTQQLVKNAFLSQEQTFSRKAKEIFIAIEVENQYSKAEILTMYLNNAYFGHGVWGIQDAAQRYFATDAGDLTVPQAATLAGMLTAPGIYNPIDHPTATKQRRNLVLDLMVENGKLSQRQATAYQQTPLVVKNGYRAPNTYKYPSFFDAVIAEAISKYGLDEKEVMNNGYKIYTTLDQGQQRAMQQVFDDDDNFPANLADGSMVQAASVAIDPKTGGVLAMFGGRGQHVFRGYNRVTQMRRQPGSTIKPIAVYLPALQHGYFYDSTLQDEKTTYGTGKKKYTPKNYDDQYSGKVPMYKALYESLNAPAVWLLNKIGVTTGYKMAQAFGLPVEKSDQNLALALGGLTKGVSPLQLARAYAVFASGGQLPTTHLITKVVDSTGHEVKRKDKLTTKRIIKRAQADEMTSMMLDVFKLGTAQNAKPSGYTLAGKTGTTNSGLKENDSDRDKWIVGYTPDVVVATWEGYDDTTVTQQLSDVEERDLASLYRTEMASLLPHTAGTTFTVKDAQTRAMSGTKSPSKNLWQQAGELADQVKQGLSQAWDNVRSLFR